MSDNWKDAEENCAHLLSLNEKRVGLQDEVWTQAQSQCEEQMEKGFPVLIVRGEWHEGVLGIVASKVVEKYYRPSIVLNSEKEVLKGSMRSTKGFHCVKLLEASAKYLKTFGGHEQAAGLQLLDLHFELFQESICSFAKDYLSKESLAERVIVYDAQWNLAEGVSEKDFLNLESFAPYGPGNSEVLLLVKNVTLPKNYKILKEKHIKWSGPNGLEFVAFGKVKEILNCSDQANKAIDILVTPEINRFRGSSRLQCRIEHVRPCITENTFS
jgi:single-stranded-DNA-specific exonuclease